MPRHSTKQEGRKHRIPVCVQLIAPTLCIVCAKVAIVECECGPFCTLECANKYHEDREKQIPFLQP
jgi:hypothetical protein